MHTTTYRIRAVPAVLAMFLVAGCADRRGAVQATPLRPQATASQDRPARARVGVGLASYYGDGFQGQETASGTTFDKNALVAAHPTLPFGTRVRVTNIENGRSVILRVVDRGPTEPYQDEGVIIDVSERAARVLGFIRDGRQWVRLTVIEQGNGERASR